MPQTPRNPRTRPESQNAAAQLSYKILYTDFVFPISRINIQVSTNASITTFNDLRLELENLNTHRQAQHNCINVYSTGDDGGVAACGRIKRRTN